MTRHLISPASAERNVFSVSIAFTQLVLGGPIGGQDFWSWANRRTGFWSRDPIMDLLMHGDLLKSYTIASFNPQ